MSKKHMNAQLIIVGGGGTGAAEAYAATHFMKGVNKVILIERGNKLGAVNTAPRNNSQTLHDGSIETNYSPTKAGHVKIQTDVTKKYLHQHAASDVYRIGQKMVIGVGEAEGDFLKNHFENIQPHYKNLKLLTREGVARREPKVIEGRKKSENVIAIASDEGYMIDFQRLAESMVEQAMLTNKLQVVHNTTIVSATEVNVGVHTLTDQDGNTYTADAVIFATGGHSLLYARELGYAQHLGLLPVAGNFFSAPHKKFLNGKVYTVQNPKLPFAAVHGDPEIFDTNITRFGPTAKVLPMLIRGDYSTIADFLQVSVPNFAGIATLTKILADPTMSGYMLKNVGYDMPWLGKYLFLQTARKIIPTLQYGDLVATGFGGIRPQIVNTITRSLEMGNAQIVGRNIIFNVTPSPGASVSLYNAMVDMKQLCAMLPQFTFDTDKWEVMYGAETLIAA